MKFDVVIIGGGLAGMTAASALQGAGFRCAVISEGLSLHNVQAGGFKAAGGTMLAGDRVIGGSFDGDRLKEVSTEKLSGIPIEADNFILATGKYFSKGIVADMDKVYEPLFGLDVDFDSDRSTWFSQSFAAPQRFLQFGVKAEDGRALRGGRQVANLFPAGEVLAGISGAQGDATESIRRSALDAVSAIRNK